MSAVGGKLLVVIKRQLLLELRLEVLEHIALGELGPRLGQLGILGLQLGRVDVGERLGEVGAGDCFRDLTVNDGLDDAACAEVTIDCRSEDIGNFFELLDFHSRFLTRSQLLGRAAGFPHAAGRWGKS